MISKYLTENERLYLYQTQMTLLNDKSSVDNLPEKIWALMIVQKAANGDPLYRDWCLTPDVEGSFLNCALRRLAADKLEYNHESVASCLDEIAKGSTEHIGPLLYMLSSIENQEMLAGYKKRLEQIIDKQATELNDRFKNHHLASHV